MQEKTKNASTSVEKREFRLHKDILFSIIQKQAGTIGKALLELVMNSVDAGATRVDITLSETGFSIRDDGKGFTSRTEIEEFFETFGTPHTQGDATYGRFRMGRGQIMAFTRNRWHSGPFQMNVDIRDLGLRYELTEDGTLFNGCAIEGEFYKELKPSEHLTVSQEIASLVQYCPIPVYLDGERISLDLSKEKWTHQDDYAYYKIQESKESLAVYNLGVHVRNYPASSVGGAGGLVVSKQQLEVNFARNDVLTSDCAVWPNILTRLRAIARSNEAKKPTKNAAYRVAQAMRLISGDYDNLIEMYNALFDEPVLTDIRGRHYSLVGVVNAASSKFQNQVVVSPSADSRIADRLHSQGLALVLSSQTLSNFGNIVSIEALCDKLNIAIAKVADGLEVNSCYKAISNLRKQAKNFNHAAANIRDFARPVENKKLTREERRVLKALTAGEYRLLYLFYKKGMDRRLRKLWAGESETARAWTNGRSDIWINRDELKIDGTKGGALKGFFRLATLLLHEYCHDAQTIDSHMHNEEFYENYHNLLTDKSSAVALFVQDAVSFYIQERLRDKDKIRMGEKIEIDFAKSLTQIEEGESEGDGDDMPMPHDAMQQLGDPMQGLNPLGLTM